MGKTSTGRPRKKRERILKLTLVLFIYLNLLRVTTIQVSYLRQDLIPPSLPAIRLESLQLTHLPLFRDLLGEIKSTISTQVDAENHTLVNPSVTSSEQPALGSFNTTASTSNELGLTMLPAEQSPTSSSIYLPMIFNKYRDPNTHYYVAPNGNDSNPGTESHPWRTIQKAANTMTAGYTVVVFPGEYDERVYITSSGTSGHPITYEAEGTVTMKGFTVTADYITIEGFDITDTEDDWSDGWGVFVEGSHCVLENNYVYFATRGGIILFANGGDDPVTSNCVVMNNRLHRNSQVGIEVQGRNNLIEGNEIWRTIQYHPKWTNPPGWVDADGMRFFGVGHTIQKNYIHDIKLDDPENVNPHIDCFQTWGSGAGQDIIFEQNYCENLNEGMYAFMLQDANNLIIRNNIIQAYGGMNTGGGGNSHLTIVNNIFANDLSFQAYPGGIGLESCPHAIVKNNIFYDQPHHTISVTGNRSGQEIDYNLAYRSDGQPSACYKIEYQCVDPAPAHDLWDVDPLFIDPAFNDFHLLGGSPAIDAGIALAEVSNDFDGVPRPQGDGYDIGTFEYLAR
jgi:parallel beta-helix repeat protein